MHVEQVVQIPFFQGLPAEALRLVAADSTMLALKRGRILMSQHDAAEHLFFLISGVVQFYIHFQGVDICSSGRCASGARSSAGRFPGAISVHGHHAMRGGLSGHAASPRSHHGTCADAAASRLSAAKAGPATLANRLEQTRDILVTPAASGGMPKASA